MFLTLFIGLGLLHYGGCGNWSVQYAQNVYELTTTCITLQCTYTYPPSHQLKAEVWMASLQGPYRGNEEVIVYHTNKDQIHPSFRGRTMFLGQMNGDCSLKINGLERKDQGEYGFKLETEQTLFSSDRSIVLSVDRLYLSREREKNQIPTSCPRCTIWPNGLLIVILVAAVIAMIISVAVSTWCCLKNKKKSNAAAATELALISSNQISGNLVYTNVENPYTALDQTQISPYYEDVKRQDRPT